MCRNYCGHLGCHPDSLAERRFHIVPLRLFIRVEGRQRRDRRPEHIHRVRVLDGFDYRKYLFRQLSLTAQLFIERIQMFLLRQFAMQQQIGRLFEI